MTDPDIEARAKEICATRPDVMTNPALPSEHCDMHDLSAGTNGYCPGGYEEAKEELDG